MPKVGALIESILKAYGHDVADPKFAEIVAIDTDLPDNVEADFSKYFTMEGAKNNYALKSYFTQKALSGIDMKIEEIANEYQLPEEDQNELKTIKSTFDKVKIVAGKIADLTGKKMSSNSGKEKETYTQQIEQLNKQIVEIKADGERQINELRKSYTDRTKDLLLKHKIASRKLDTSKFGSDIMQTIAIDQLNKALNERGAKVLYDNDNLILKQANEPSLDYYENNAPVLIDNFIDKVLADNKLLAVNDPNSAPGGTGTVYSNNQPPTSQSTNGHRPLTGLISRLDQLEKGYNERSR